MRRGLIAAAVVLVLDQIVKAWIVSLFADKAYNYIHVLPVFNLVMAWNKGVSFGMFNSGALGALAFAGLGAVIVAALLCWLWKAEGRWLQIAIGMVVGGAIGNIADRITRGAVVDFLDFHLGDWHWYAFNVADAAICLGVVFIALDGLLGEKRQD